MKVGRRRSGAGAGSTLRAEAGGGTIAPARPLLAWYDRRQRDLPWRREVSAYRTLVSEFMLQQTVVAAAVPFFERFVARFPDLAALAAASEDEVLTLWSGLGYYARARNLHRAARAVVEQHGGQLPRDEHLLRALPGVGPYTAAAVAAIAFGRRTFALDGNAARVVARLSMETAAVAQPATRDRLRATGLTWVPSRRPGDFAQAVMELGATLCTPRAPDCPVCPLRELCAARAQGQTAAIPRKAVRAVKRLVRLASVRLRHRDRVLLVRRADGLLAGTWMLPSAPVEDGDAAIIVARGALRGLGIRPLRLTMVGSVRHLFTHRDVTAEVFEMAVVGPSANRARPLVPAAAPEEARWVKEGGLHEIALSSFVRKQLALRSGYAAARGLGRPPARPPRSC
ncbi:MAG: A/G-specific adenine glycosylase [Polyangia bacterium]